MTFWGGVSVHARVSVRVFGVVHVRVCVFVCECADTSKQDKTFVTCKV